MKGGPYSGWEIRRKSIERCLYLLLYPSVNLLTFLSVLRRPHVAGYGKLHPLSAPTFFWLSYVPVPLPTSFLFGLVILSIFFTQFFADL